MTSSVINYSTDARQHGIYLLNRETSGSLGELIESVSTAFSSSPKLSQVFQLDYELENTEYMFISFRKQLVYFDLENVKSLCSCHDYVNSPF